MNGASLPVPIAGRLLVATPELVDPNFSHTVVLLLAVRPEGVLGIVLNRPSDRRVDEVLPRWSARVAAPSVVFFGGPVALDTVVGLSASGAVDLDDAYFDDITLDDDGSSDIRLFAGSAGWGPEQLEDEIADGSWWVFDAEPGDVTTSDPETLWQRVLRRQVGMTSWFALATADPAYN
ncbi:MAG: YqgE/AlgH family protein [Actinobacteria bacterium]|nr:YqgE/AlgH family protein [Actinomycetota bacterium]